MRHHLLLWLCLLLAPAAIAQNPPCSISVPAIHLGTYAGSRVATGVTPVSVVCPPSTSYTIGLRSNAGGASNSVRAMRGSRGAKLNYQLFQDAAHSVNWGSEIGTDVVAGVGTGSVQRFNIYPVLLQGQPSPQGEYTDAVTVSVTSNRGTYSVNVPVIANATGLCVVLSTSMAFGSYGGSAIASTSTISLTCTANITYDIALSAGTTTGATPSARKMAGPNGGMLSYGLYRDAAMTLNWGATSGSDTLTGVATGLLQPITVYGKIPAGQIVPIGNYSDSITATITY
ncbi:Spore coat protein U (SCPU) domain-containing protein [Terriglobus roseus]|uniref:Spore coat protein U (SCPU) domain-containing protein n=1 Tax=Terriglobus roseus TaxID=392734 RepID=A0A1H4ITY1_9BACT|nr:Spore coat protein U (SCPU) domain-containing protein [Terriglobus roseus]